jgi:hypothetical protein
MASVEEIAFLHSRGYGNSVKRLEKMKQGAKCGQQNENDELACELGLIQFNRKQLVGFPGRRHQAMNSEKDLIYEQEDPGVRDPSTSTFYGSAFSSREAKQFSNSTSNTIFDKTSSIKIPRDMFPKPDYGGDFNLEDFYDPHFEAMADLCGQHYPESSQRAFDVDHMTFETLANRNQRDFGIMDSVMLVNRAQWNLRDNREAKQQGSLDNKGF